MLAQVRAQLLKLERGFRTEEIAQAAARVERLDAQLAEAVAGPRPQEIEVARADLRRAEASLELARTEIRRTQRLFEKDAATADEVDQAQRAMQESVETVKAQQERLALLEEGTRKEQIAQARAALAEARAAHDLVRNGYRAEEIEQARASVAAAEASLAMLAERIAELKILAPVAGTVEALGMRRGDLVAPNAPVLTILDPARLWVRAYVPEDKIAFQLGARVEVRVDAYPDRAFQGEITFIASQAEFVPGNIQTPEERAKQVFRITVDLREGLDLLRAGMPADVRFP
jgi:multidrug resistance efflux pump